MFNFLGRQRGIAFGDGVAAADGLDGGWGIGLSDDAEIRGGLVRFGRLGDAPDEFQRDSFFARGSNEPDGEGDESEGELPGPDGGRHEGRRVWGEVRFPVGRRGNGTDPNSLVSQPFFRNGTAILRAGMPGASPYSLRILVHFSTLCR